jgi:hypothetical protein
MDQKPPRHLSIQGVKTANQHMPIDEESEPWVQ